MSILLHRLGFALRESGQALERVGCRLQGINSFEEELTRLRPAANFQALAPSVDSSAYVAPTAAVVGDVSLGSKSSVWYNCVVRGDVQPVSIGSGSNLQDGVYAGSLLSSGHKTVVGDNVSVGHGATLRGCVVEDNCLIGMDSVLQEGSHVESGAIVAAGAIVEPGGRVPSGEIWGGNPARKLRDLKPQEKQYLGSLPQKYCELAAQHSTVLAHLHSQVEKISQAGAA